MKEKRFKNWSPELDLDLRDKIENLYTEDYEEQETLYHKEDSMKINKSKIIWWVIILVFLVWYFLYPTEKQIQEVSVDSNTEKQIQEVRKIANERNIQKELRKEIREKEAKIKTSIDNVKKSEKKIEEYRKSSLQLIK